MNAPQRPGPDADPREALLDSQRRANQDEPRNFKEDALTDKVVSVGPDGTGPTSTDTFDAEADQARGSGGDDPAQKETRSTGSPS